MDRKQRLIPDTGVANQAAFPAYPAAATTSSRMARNRVRMAQDEAAGEGRPYHSA